MTRPFDDFLPEIMPQVPGCPEALVINAVRNAAIEFCSFTRYWRATLTLDAVANQTNYTLTPMAGAEIAHVERVNFDGRQILEADSLSGDWESDKAADPLRYLIELSGSDYTLRPHPTVNRNLTGGFVVKVSLKPSRAATEVGARVYVDHLETIAAGALAQLLMMQGKPWFNGNLAVLNESAFAAGKARARITSGKGFTNANKSVQMRTFA